MAYGFRAVNDAGSTILDSDLGQVRLIASGSSAATSTNATISTGLSTNPYTTISFSTCSNPLIFVRPQATSVYVYIMAITTSSFSYRSTGTIDYRVYDAGAFPSYSGYGIQIYDSAGTVLYNNNYALPFIKEIQTALFSTDTYPVAPNPPSLIRNLSTAVTGYDGGLPFVSAFTFCPINSMQGAGWTSYTCATIYFSNATTLGIYCATALKVGTTPSYTLYNTGQTPRKVLITR